MEKLESPIKQFLVSSISGEGAFLSNTIDHHEVIFDLYQSGPQILTGVVPFITGELLVKQPGHSSPPHLLLPFFFHVLILIKKILPVEVFNIVVDPYYRILVMYQSEHTIPTISEIFLFIIYLIFPYILRYICSVWPLLSCIASLS